MIMINYFLLLLQLTSLWASYGYVQDIPNVAQVYQVPKDPVLTVRQIKNSIIKIINYYQMRLPFSHEKKIPKDAKSEVLFEAMLIMIRKAVSVDESKIRKSKLITTEYVVELCKRSEHCEEIFHIDDMTQLLVGSTAPTVVKKYLECHKYFAALMMASMDEFIRLKALKPAAYDTRSNKSLTMVDSGRIEKRKKEIPVVDNIKSTKETNVMIRFEPNSSKQTQIHILCRVLNQFRKALKMPTLDCTDRVDFERVLSVILNFIRMACDILYENAHFPVYHPIHQLIPMSRITMIDSISRVSLAVLEGSDDEMLVNFLGALQGKTVMVYEYKSTTELTKYVLALLAAVFPQVYFEYYEHAVVFLETEKNFFGFFNNQKSVIVDAKHGLDYK